MVFDIQFLDFLQFGTGRPNGWFIFFLEKFSEELYMICDYSIQMVIKDKLMAIILQTKNQSLFKKVCDYLSVIRQIDNNWNGEGEYIPPIKDVDYQVIQDKVSHYNQSLNIAW